MPIKQKEIPIDDAPFLKSLLKRSGKLCFTKSNKIKKRFNSKEVYEKDILETCLRIHALFTTLRLSRFFLDERRNIHDGNTLKIKNAEFIRYHLECYFIRITTYKDLILKLINRVCYFKVKENIGLEKNLRKRIEQENLNEISQLLEGLEILMKEIEPIRNRIAHGGYHEDHDLIIIEAIELHKNVNENDLNYQNTLNRLLGKNIVDMCLIEVMMATFLLLIYKKLYPIRRRIKRMLSIYNP